MATEGTYDTRAAKEISLDYLIKIMQGCEVNKIYVKKLAPNDNSKNQPYFGAQLTDVSFLPVGELVPSETTSDKPRNKSRKIKYQASVSMAWVDSEGNIFDAPHTKLIFYPQYPEVRFSGFLKGSQVDAGEWMDPRRLGRAEGRWLVLGVSPTGKVFSYLVVPESRLEKELRDSDMISFNSVFSIIDLTQISGETNTKDSLLIKLREIHELGWVTSRKLNTDGTYSNYMAQNGGGYTLEALLGVSPNGIAEPDYLGWEVKQFSVKEFPLKGVGPTTLMTPEPDGGFYGINRVLEFVKRYGYPDQKGKKGRMNFGGVHYCGKRTSKTGLTMLIEGFDPENIQITDAKGFIGLVDENDQVAASWSFAKIMEHWKKKHSQAVYVASMKRLSPSGGVEYRYGKDIELGTGAEFQRMLYSIHSGFLYYDPGIKVENIDTPRPRSKARSQFRIKHNYLSSLYKNYEFVDIKNNL